MSAHASPRGYWNRRSSQGGIASVLDAALPVAANQAYSRWASPLGAGEHVGPWLDVACGIGRSLSILGDRVQRIGVDLSEGMLRCARDAAPDALLVQGSAASLPFRNDQFPRVVCTDLLLHLPDAARRQTLGELARILAPGGRLLLTSNHDRCLFRMRTATVDQEGYHRSWTSLQGVREVLEPLGCRLLEARSDPFQSLLSLPARAPGVGPLLTRLADRLRPVASPFFAVASLLDRRMPLTGLPGRFAFHMLVLFEKESTG